MSPSSLPLPLSRLSCFIHLGLWSPYLSYSYNVPHWRSAFGIGIWRYTVTVYRLSFTACRIPSGFLYSTHYALRTSHFVCLFPFLFIFSTRFLTPVSMAFFSYTKGSKNYPNTKANPNPYVLSYWLESQFRTVYHRPISSQPFAWFVSSFPLFLFFFGTATSVGVTHAYVQIYNHKSQSQIANRNRKSLGFHNPIF